MGTTRPSSTSLTQVLLNAKYIKINEQIKDVKGITGKKLKSHLKESHVDIDDLTKKYDYLEEKANLFKKPIKTPENSEPQKSSSNCCSSFWNFISCGYACNNKIDAEEYSNRPIHQTM